jgi:hypothetical protein
MRASLIPAILCGKIYQIKHKVRRGGGKATDSDRFLQLDIREQADLPKVGKEQG